MAEDSFLMHCGCELIRQSLSIPKTLFIHLKGKWLEEDLALMRRYHSVSHDCFYPLKGALMCCNFPLCVIWENKSAFKWRQFHLGTKQFLSGVLHGWKTSFWIVRAPMWSVWYSDSNCGPFSWETTNWNTRANAHEFFSLFHLCIHHSSLDWISIVWELDPSHSPKGFTEPEKDKITVKENDREEGDNTNKNPELGKSLNQLQ